MKTCNILNSGVSPLLIRNFDQSVKCKVSYKGSSLMKLGRSHFRGVRFSTIESFKDRIKLEWTVIWFFFSRNTLKSTKELEAHFSHCVHWQGINLNWLQTPACCQPTAQGVSSSLSAANPGTLKSTWLLFVFLFHQQTVFKKANTRVMKVARERQIYNFKGRCKSQVEKKSSSFNFFLTKIRFWAFEEISWNKKIWIKKDKI